MRFSLLVFFYFGFSACTKAVEPVRVIAVNEPPANFLNKSGYADGLVVDIVKAMQETIGNTQKIEFIPEARALNIVDTESNILLFSLSRTQFREDKYHWIGKVFSKNWQIFTQVDSSLKIGSMDDLAEISALGVVRGDVREEWLVNRNYTNLYSVTQHEQNIQLLLHGRLPAIVYEQQGMTYLCEKLRIDCQQFKPIYTLHQSDVYLIMSKKTPIETVQLWQHTYKNLLSTGKIGAISRKWHDRLLTDLNIDSHYNGEFLTF